MMCKQCKMASKVGMIQNTIKGGAAKENRQNENSQCNLAYSHAHNLSDAERQKKKRTHSCFPNH